MTDNLEELERLLAKATPGPWGIWFEQINGKADKAIQELIEQVHATDPIGNSLVMLDADGKCPAITGCGPTSADNAALIVALRNAAPSLIATAREVEGLRAALSDAIALIGHRMPMDTTALVAGEKLVAGAVWKAGIAALGDK